eukprot:CAMPEP_0172457210 /NCGR_PEP_ID=MMETSP1065-20121228/20799_1 /TAXON_ID=265537 /ORGANISM="Amphiprora paludosa, Strain CCMP125" /LENGTH=92 /DNA_ID=CAMNT_0013210803 /DNA_START=880 /DNA_END=1155 /DNA_ORIENTATION=-
MAAIPLHGGRQGILAVNLVGSGVIFGFGLAFTAAVDGELAGSEMTTCHGSPPFLSLKENRATIAAGSRREAATVNGSKVPCLESSAAWHKIF